MHSRMFKLAGRVSKPESPRNTYVVTLEAMHGDADAYDYIKISFAENQIELWIDLTQGIDELVEGMIFKGLVESIQISYDYKADCINTNIRLAQ